jgi:hypothetical protein
MPFAIRPMKQGESCLALTREANPGSLHNLR